LQAVVCGKFAVFYSDFVGEMCEKLPMAILIFLDFPNSKKRRNYKHCKLMIDFKNWANLF